MNRYFFAVALVVSFAFSAFAGEETAEEKMASFRLTGDVAPVGITVPTVVEIPLAALPFARAEIAVFDATEQEFVPFAVIRQEKDTGLPVQISSRTSRGNDRFLNDADFTTHVDFDLPEDRAGEAVLIFTAAAPFAADALWIGLANHAALPENIEIRAEVDGVSRIVVAESDKPGICAGCTVFPETRAEKWQVKLRYGQPLRIAEIGFRQTHKQAVHDVSLRFLTQPEHTYKIFRDPDRAVLIPAGEAGDLRTDKDILRLAPFVEQSNVRYHESDVDQDGVADARDNCVAVANADQADINGNLRGDACDDYDRDRIINSKDNCPNHPNAAQQDADGDRAGDACDKEESRITEKYAWLPWIALAGAAALMLFFFLRVAKGTPPKDMPPKDMP